MSTESRHLFEDLLDHVFGRQVPAAFRDFDQPVDSKLLIVLDAVSLHDAVGVENQLSNG